MQQGSMKPSGRPITVAIVGAGQRGRVYASFCVNNPELARVVAIAEPSPRRRSHLAASHPHAAQFSSYLDLLSVTDFAPNAVSTGGPARLADAVVVAVQDGLHQEVVNAFAGRGYHILCEKPMATTLEACRDMCRTVEEAGVIFGIGHVLRYSPYNAAMIDILRSGELGDIINIHHLEPVGAAHFAHSYVRGNWSREKDSSFSLLTKCCHDLDVLLWYMQPHKLSRVSSFGNLSHFKKSKKPAAAGDVKRCFDCPTEVSDRCPYSAETIYLEPTKRGNVEWPVDTITEGPPDLASVTKALEETNYGACVYELDNDVVDHQVVNLEFENGATASLTMVAFTTLVCERQTRIHCSHGEIIGDSNSLRITVFGNPTKTRTLHPTSSYLQDRLISGGHGGGDMGLMRTFVTAVREGKQEVLGVTPREALRSHEAVFAAETSRRSGQVVTLS